MRKDENSQKESLIRDKRKLMIDDCDIQDIMESKYRRFSMVGLCSIPEFEWNTEARAVEKNLKQVYPFLNFTYILRGQHSGQIVFDERVSSMQFTGEANEKGR